MSVDEPDSSGSLAGMTDAAAASLYRERDFAIFLSARFLATVAVQVMSVAVGWQIYAIARDPLALGMVGLAQFVPMFVLTLPAGDVSDRVDQRLVYALALGIFALCGVGFVLLTLSHPTQTWPFYVILARVRRGARLFGPVRLLAAALSGADGAPAQGDRLELLGLPDGGHRRPGAGRLSLCAGAGRGLCGLRGLLPGGGAGHLDPGRAPAGRGHQQSSVGL